MHYQIKKLKNHESVNVTLNNNSNDAIDVLIFVFYSDELKVDVGNEIVTKKITNFNIIV